MAELKKDKEIKVHLPQITDETTENWEEEWITGNDLAD